MYAGHATRVHTDQLHKSSVISFLGTRMTGFKLSKAVRHLDTTAYPHTIAVTLWSTSSVLLPFSIQLGPPTALAPSCSAHSFSIPHARFRAFKVCTWHSATSRILQPIDSHRLSRLIWNVHATIGSHQSLFPLLIVSNQLRAFG